MLIGEFDDILYAKPFQPFMVVTADGRSLYVKGPEYAWHPPDAVRLVWVAKEDTGGTALIDIHFITQLVVGERPLPTRPRKRRANS